jgi:hypothetical protein
MESMLVRLQRGVAVVTVATGVIGCGLMPWQSVKPSGGGFSVQMPASGRCKRSVGLQELGGLKGWSCSGRNSRFAQEFRGLDLFGVDAYPVPSGTDIESGQETVVSSEARDLAKIEFRIVSEESRRIAGSDWHEIDAESTRNPTQLRARVLVLVKPEGVFALRIMAAAATWPERDVEHFLRSFSFEGMPGEESSPRPL